MKNLQFSGIYRVISLGMLFGLLLFLTLNRHSKSGIQNYHSEIWADKAGYYVYLPGYFIYDMKATDLPEGIAEKTGRGFTTVGDRILTKYTYGVALMQAPFFLAARLVGASDDGFGPVYHKMIDIAAVTYAFFSLLILFAFLRRYFSKLLAGWTVAVLFAGSNLFYYAVFETGMSHIYSFFLFSCFLYISPFIFQARSNFLQLALAGIIAGLIVAVRPVNILFLPAVLFFYPANGVQQKELFVRPCKIMPVAFLVLIPQFLYWKYAHGSFLYYSYEGEGFSNIYSPKIVELWFSTRNGLFIFNPLLLLVPAGFFVMDIFPRLRRILFAAYFVLLSLVFASWHDWSYGCAYGSRPFPEFYALLALPLASFLKHTITERKQRLLALVFVVLAVSWNLKLIFSYDGCWYGGDWDWQALLDLLTARTK